MKTILALAALVSAVLGAPVQEQSAPKGLYFVVPPAPAQQQQQQQHITPEQVEEVMNQLRQEDGSDSGVYHIVLPDGRLQRVEFTTAPVSSQVQTEEVAQQVEQPLGPAALVAYISSPVKEAAAKEAAEDREAPAGPAALLAQSPRAAVRAEEIKLSSDSRLFLVAQAAEDVQQKESPNKAQLNEEPAKPAKYVASIHYTEVQPITGPIYSYNSQPLTRIVRYAPLY